MNPNKKDYEVMAERRIHFWWIHWATMHEVNDHLTTRHSWNQARLAWSHLILISDEISSRQDAGKWDCACEVCVMPF